MSLKCAAASFDTHGSLTPWPEHFAHQPLNLNHRKQRVQEAQPNQAANAKQQVENGSENDPPNPSRPPAKGRNGFAK
jgi:hypothetical protein